MNNVGYAWENGQGGLPKDDAGAVNWYREAAKAGSASLACRERSCAIIRPSAATNPTKASRSETAKQ